MTGSKAIARPTLFAIGFSPSCQRVFATLAHKGVDYDLVEIDVTKKERPAEFNALTPFGKVPVLVHVNSDKGALDVRFGSIASVPRCPR